MINTRNGDRNPKYKKRHKFYQEVVPLIQVITVESRYSKPLNYTELPRYSKPLYLLEISPFSPLLKLGTGSTVKRRSAERVSKRLSTIPGLTHSGSMRD